MLAICRVAAPRDQTAALALARWSALQAACTPRHSPRERRFRRRAFERARDQALITFALER